MKKDVFNGSLNGTAVIAGYGGGPPPQVGAMVGLGVVLNQSPGATFSVQQEVGHFERKVRLAFFCTASGSI